MKSSIIASVHEERTCAELAFEPILVGICGSMGMMPTYHAESAQANPRISVAKAVYGSRESALKMAQLYGIERAFFRDNDSDGRIFTEFLGSHELTVIATPNHLHVPQAIAALTTHKGFVYVEKPSAHDLEGAVALEALEKGYPGRVAVVAHNRLWSGLLEMRHMIREGEIGDVTNVEIQYQQDWQRGDTSVGWRALKGVVGEKGNERDGVIGKLTDIAFHAIDTLLYTTGLEVRAVAGAHVANVEPQRKKSSGEAFGAAHGEGDFIAVGNDSPYHSDDVMYATLILANNAPARLTVSQTDAGKKNHLSIGVYGKKGSLSFSTDNPMNIIRSRGGPITECINYCSPTLGYTQTFPKWLIEGIDLRPNAPFGWHTPPDHMTGWKEVHRKQLQTFALYANLVLHDDISVDQRSQLYMIPTAAEAATVMRVMKTVYEAAARQQQLAVDHTRRQ